MGPWPPLGEAWSPCLGTISSQGLELPKGWLGLSNLSQILRRGCCFPAGGWMQSLPGPKLETRHGAGLLGLGSDPLSGESWLRAVP